MINYLNYRLDNSMGNISTHSEDDEVPLPKPNDCIWLNQPDIIGTFIVKGVKGPFVLSDRRTYTVDLTANHSA